MKEIIKIERLLETIGTIWESVAFQSSDVGKQHFIDLYSTFGSYPDLTAFESELIQGGNDTAVKRKVSTIKSKCSELINLYNDTIKNEPIKTGVLEVGRLDSKVINPTDGSYDFVLMLTTKSENNSTLTKLRIDNNDLIRDLKRIYQIIDETSTGTPEKTFAELLICDKDEEKNQIIDRIQKLPTDKPKNVFYILSALINNRIILETDKSKIYRAFAAEFSYKKSVDSLESSCNNLFKKKSEGDKSYNYQIEKIENHLFD